MLAPGPWCCSTIVLVNGRQETLFKTVTPVMPRMDPDGLTAGAGLTGAVACSQSLAWAWHTVGPWEAFTEVLTFSVQGT